MRRLEACGAFLMEFSVYQLQSLSVQNHQLRPGENYGNCHSEWEVFRKVALRINIREDTEAKEELLSEFPF